MVWTFVFRCFQRPIPLSFWLIAKNLREEGRESVRYEFLTFLFSYRSTDAVLSPRGEAQW